MRNRFTIVSFLLSGSPIFFLLLFGCANPTGPSDPVLPLPLPSIIMTNCTDGDDSIDGDRFGYSVSVSGNTLAIGAPDHDHGYGTGAVYIFEKQIDGSWNQDTKLTASDPRTGDLWGDSISLFNDTLVVGNYKDDDYRGSAYIFERSFDGSWSQKAKLSRSDLSEFDYFGQSVAASDSRVIIGAPNHILGGYRGKAFIYEKDTDGSWDLEAILNSGSTDSGSWFGTAVSISDDTALVGARGYRNNGISTGLAYIFSKDSEGNWNQTNILAADDGVARDGFGCSVDISEDVAIIGACGDDSDWENSGSAYIFRRQIDDSWIQVAKISASDSITNHKFGASVSIDGNKAVVGAPYYRKQTETSRNCGAIYIYEKDIDGAWALKSKKIDHYRVTNEFYVGRSVSISGGTVVAGAPGGWVTNYCMLRPGIVYINE